LSFSIAPPGRESTAGAFQRRCESLAYERMGPEVRKTRVTPHPNARELLTSLDPM